MNSTAAAAPAQQKRLHANQASSATAAYAEIAAEGVAAQVAAHGFLKYSESAQADAPQAIPTSSMSAATQSKTGAATAVLHAQAITL